MKVRCKVASGALWSVTKGLAIGCAPTLAFPPAAGWCIGAGASNGVLAIGESFYVMYKSNSLSRSYDSLEGKYNECKRRCGTASGQACSVV